jgi:hypothetical protein
MSTTFISKFDRQKQRIEQSQFVYSLHPDTLLPIEIAAGPCSKAVSTFQTDVTRRPHTLPRLTHIGTRIFVRVQDLLDFINPAPTTTTTPAPASIPGKRRRGRPTKSKQAAAMVGGAI